MKERPIIFTGESVRAILAGRKTQTRRIRKYRHLTFIGGQGEQDDPDAWGWFFDGPDHNGYMVLGRGHNERHNHGRISIPCPYGEPGDTLWVKEGFALAPLTDDPDPEDQDDWSPVYRADGDERPWRTSHNEDADEVPPPWKSPLFMPRWASRITLRVTSVRVERLQAITEDDAQAEGVDEMGGMVDAAAICRAAKEAGLMAESHAAMFGALWDSIDGKRAPWSSNPWVWVVGFEVVK